MSPWQERSLMVRWVAGSILQVGGGGDPLCYFSFQPVLHNWYNKGHGMCCLWYGAYKIDLAVNQKRVAHVAAAGFLSHYLSGPTPYKIKCVECVIK